MKLEVCQSLYRAMMRSTFFLCRAGVLHYGCRVKETALSLGTVHAEMVSVVKKQAGWACSGQVLPW